MMFSPEDRAEIGKYVLLKMGTLQLFINIVLERTPLACSRQSTSLPYVLKRKMGIMNQMPIAPGLRGRPLLPGELDKKVQAYIWVLRDAGDSIGSSIVIAALYQNSPKSYYLSLSFISHSFNCNVSFIFIIQPNLFTSQSKPTIQ